MERKHTEGRIVGYRWNTDLKKTAANVRVSSVAKQISAAEQEIERE
jgi:hypothetical protein